jgi:hypothetical protein
LNPKIFFNISVYRVCRGAAFDIDQDLTGKPPEEALSPENESGVGDKLSPTPLRAKPELLCPGKIVAGRRSLMVAST